MRILKRPSATRCRWKFCPVGMEIHNVEMVPGQGGKLCRSAGGVARLIGKDAGFATMQLPSRRSPADSLEVPGDDRPAWQYRLDQHSLGQGRPHAASRDSSRRFAAWRRTRSATRWVAAKAVPAAVVTRSASGACPPRAARPATRARIPAARLFVAA